MGSGAKVVRVVQCDWLTPNDELLDIESVLDI